MDKTSFPRPGGGHMLFCPGGMVHSAKLGETGADQLDVFWPVRPDYVDRAQSSRRSTSSYRASTKPKKLAEGFTFTEGPTWLKGKLYFSDMFFKNPAAGDWTGSPAQPADRHGSRRQVARAVDRHAVERHDRAAKRQPDRLRHVRPSRVEVDPATGRVVRVVLDKVNGKPIDGPNDLVMDAKGGLYITDPQFTPESKKSQPGKQVTTSRPTGRRVVIGPGEYAMPNGVELSPDGKTLYVNNTWQQPGENFVWAYDVADRRIAVEQAAVRDAEPDA